MSFRGLFFTHILWVHFRKKLNQYFYFYQSWFSQNILCKECVHFCHLWIYAISPHSFCCCNSVAAQFYFWQRGIISSVIWMSDWLIIAYPLCARLLYFFSQVWESKVQQQLRAYSHKQRKWKDFSLTASSGALRLQKCGEPAKGSSHKVLRQPICEEPAKWIEWWEDTRAKVQYSSCSCLRQTPLHLHPAPLPPPPPPPQLAPFKSEVTVSERSVLFKDELQLLLLLFVSPSLPVFLHPPPLSPVLFDFLRGFFVGVTPLNGTMQPSVKLKLLVSLELLKRGFYTCMHSYTLPYAIDIAN